MPATCRPLIGVQAYARIPDDLKPIIAQLCGEYKEKFALGWNASDFPGEAFIKEKGVEYIELPQIWFGVIVVMVGEMGVITPPVGVNVFVIKGIAPQVPLRVIFRGIFPFLGAIILLTAVLLIFPQIATFLPNLMYP